MIQIFVGDLFESQAQTLVNTVNCVGVMGKGVALEFKRRFPAMYEDYAKRCDRGEVRLGEPYLYRYLMPPWIVNFPTKDHWRSVAKLDDIVRGLEFLIAHYREWGITSLAVPPLGCGNGQLEWRVVGPTLYRYLRRIDVPVELYAPHGTPHEELSPAFLEGGESEAMGVMPEPQWIRPGWIALVEILKRIEDQPFHWTVGRTMFQKIAYVATTQGLPTELNFRKSSYGPFSPGLNQLETRLVNNGLIREERMGSMHVVRVGPTFEDARKAYQDDLLSWESIIERTFDLFMRINTTRGAEIAATVLFAAHEFEHERMKPSERQVFDAVLDWKRRRTPPIHPDEVATAVRALAARGWLEVEPSSDLPVPEYELEPV